MNRTKSLFVKLALVGISAVALAGCYYEPAPYGYAPAPGYYAAPAYYGPPVYGSIDIGGGWGHGGGHWR